MNPEQFLAVARNLAQVNEAGPAEFRSSISRAYYCVFHGAKSFIEDEIGISLGGGGRDNIHLNLQHYFLNSGVPKAIHVGHLLGDLHVTRKEADYKLQLRKVESREQALACIQRAEELCRDFLSLGKEPFRIPLVAGITQYHKLRRGLS